MIAVQYSKLSTGKILLMGEYADEPGVLISKQFNTFDEAVAYADAN